MRRQTQVLGAIGHAARSARAELDSRGLPATAHAVAVLGGATMAIGGHVRGWTSDVAGMMRPALGGGETRLLGTRKRRRKPARRRKLTRKQIAAGFGGKRRKATRKRKGKGSRRRLTPAQKRAGFGGKRAMKRRRRRKK